jgi:hypothetical protein
LIYLKVSIKIIGKKVQSGIYFKFKQMKKQIKLIIAVAVLLSSCTTRYKIHVTEPSEGVKYYTPMQLVKHGNDIIYRWEQGPPLNSQEQAMWQINMWKKYNEHVKRARKSNVYIKIK